MIETKRLLIRPFDSNDLDIVKKLFCDEEIVEYTPFPVLDDEKAHDLLNRFAAGWEIVPQINYEMAVICKETGEKIGRSEITRYYEEESAMVGWMLIKSAWGKGFATEIAGALIDYCFTELQVHRVFALCHPDNTASWKVMEKCGMRKEAHFIQKCKYTKADGVRWEDELVYAVINTESGS